MTTFTELADRGGRVKETSAQLSKALRRAILALDDRQFTDWNRVLRQRPQRIKLHALGITEPEIKGPITLWFNIRLTPLGREVKAELQGEAAACRAHAALEQGKMNDE